MGFEKFEKGTFRGASEPKVTIRQSGTIGISKPAMVEYFDENPGAVLYFDEDSNQIGIEPSDLDEDPDAYKINASQGSGSIQATSFLKRYQLVPDETTAYDIEWDDTLGFLVVKLDQPI